jgi:hypothetical protein
MDMAVDSPTSSMGLLSPREIFRQPDTRKGSLHEVPSRPSKPFLNIASQLTPYSIPVPLNIAAIFLTFL